MFRMTFQAALSIEKGSVLRSRQSVWIVARNAAELDLALAHQETAARVHLLHGADKLIVLLVFQAASRSRPETC